LKVRRLVTLPFSGLPFSFESRQPGIFLARFSWCDELCSKGTSWLGSASLFSFIHFFFDPLLKLEFGPRLFSRSDFLPLGTAMFFEHRGGISTVFSTISSTRRRPSIFLLPRPARRHHRFSFFPTAGFSISRFLNSFLFH